MLTLATTVAAPILESVADKYGAYSFGLVAVCVLLMVLGILWLKIFAPTYAMHLEIAKANAQVTANLAAMASTLERAMTETKHVANRNQEVLDRLRRLEDQQDTNSDKEN
jgi:Tfp pilus assembly protein PilE